MSWPYRTLLRPILFSHDPEQVHDWTVAMLAWAARRELFCEAIASFFASPPLPVESLGLHFPNPVGLAAGMDKLGAATPIWPALGFGFSELGAVTWQGQPGNPRPRIFRVIPEEAIINRMGFNNAGAGALAQRLAEWRAAKRWPPHPVGINLGKSRVTPLQEAAADYAASFRALWAQADFFVVNVSSPNTPNLRQLQDKAALDEILTALQEVNRTCAGLSAGATAPAQTHGPKPVLVKVAPDLSFEALDEMLELVEPRQIAGLVATNTTISRPETGNPYLQRLYSESGGLSGRPLRARSTEVVRHLYRQTRGALPIIGVGGVFNTDDAWEKITAGATLIQIYTGLVFEGPGLAAQIVQGLRQRLTEYGLTDLRQAIGLNATS
jgi:dihydroorotate dehydrogenase